MDQRVHVQEAGAVACSSADQAPTREAFRYVQFIISLVLGTVLLYLRQPDRFLRPQFWAEDGVIFFADAHLKGLGSLVTPYNGYQHTIPRVVALFAETVAPVAEIPRVYFGAALLAIWCVILMLHLPRLGLRWPLLYSLVLTCGPVLQEVYVNLTNMLWILLLIQILILAAPEPRNRRGRILELTSFFLISISGPFILFLFPMVALRSWLTRTRYSRSILAVSVVAAAIQSLALGSSRAEGEFTLFNLDFLRLIARPLFVMLFGPRSPLEVADTMVWMPLAAATILGVGALLIAAKRSPAALSGRVVFGGVLVFLGILIGFRNSPVLLVGGGERYFHTLPTCILWGMLLVAERYRCVIFGKIVLGCWVLLMSSSLFYWSEYQRPPLARLQWRRASQCVGQGVPCMIPINPPGWTIRLERG